MLLIIIGTWPPAAADILLWKDMKQSLAAMLLLLALYYNFIASGYTIVATFSKLILVAAIFLYIHANLPERMYVYFFLSLSSTIPFVTLPIHLYQPIPPTWIIKKIERKKKSCYST